MTSTHGLTLGASDLFDAAPVGMWLSTIGPAGVVERVNPALCTLLGRRRHQLVGRSVLQVLPFEPGVREDVVSRALHGDHGVTQVVRRPDGSTRVLGVTAEQTMTGEHLSVLACFVDLTEARATEDELRTALAFQEAVLRVIPDPVRIADANMGTHVWASKELGRQLGYTDEELADHDRGQHLIHPEDMPLLADSVRRVAAAADGEVVHVRHRAIAADGSVRWIDRRKTPFRRGETGLVEQYASVMRDVTDVVVAEQRLEHAAMHDQLTGLPNRTLVSDRLRAALAATDRGGSVAVLFLDLDNFKRVNDSHGHAAGDTVLATTADRLTAGLRAGDTVGRMGGDEFVVIMSAAPADDVARLAEEVGERLRLAITAPIPYDGHVHAVTASIGVTYATVTDRADEVLRDADTAMYRAKTTGKNRMSVFDPEFLTRAIGQAELEADLRHALVKDTIEVAFQPQIHLGTGRLCGVEALLRLRGRNDLPLDTQQAVLLAEQTGLIREVGAVVLRKALAAAHHWPEDVRISVNLSAREVALPELYDRVTAALAVAVVPPARLVLELTESVLLEAAETTVRDLVRLRDLGVGIAIDDFGTGYASLQYLAALPVTSLKVDRSFTHDIVDNPTSRTITRATIGLARDLGLECVLEGVETVEQLEAIGDHPEVIGQGYLFGRPALLP